MATLTLAAVGTAAYAAYVCRRGSEFDADRPTLQSHANHHRAPDGWVEALYFFTETLRYAYSETLGRWRTADLLLGLVYLSRKEGAVHPAADIAMQGRALHADGSLPREDLQAALRDVALFKRVLALCAAQRLRHGSQPGAWAELGIGGGDIIMRSPRAGMLRPAYTVLRDAKLGAVVLVVRGTHSLKDMFTCITSAVKPHHMMAPGGVVMGYSHFGMLAAARWILKEVRDVLLSALEANEGLRPLVVGHSLGGGTAAMLTMMLRDLHPRFADTQCYAIACPSCMTLDLARSCASYVTSIVNGADVVPTFSPAAADALRTEVSTSRWYDDMRQSSRVLRIVEGGIRGVGGATMWTARNLAWGAALPVKAVQSLPPGCGAACSRPRQKLAPRSPKSEEPDEAEAALDAHTARLTARAGQRRPQAAVTSSLSFDTMPPAAAQGTALAGVPEAQRRAGLLQYVNPAGWFAACSAEGMRRRGARAGGAEGLWPAGPASSPSKQEGVGFLDRMHAGGLEAVQRSEEEGEAEEEEDDASEQFEQEIAERCEELGMCPENSLHAQMSDLLQEVAEAEQEEAAEAVSPERLSSRASSLDSRPWDTIGAATTDGGGESPRGGAEGGPTDRMGWEEKRRMYPAGRVLHLAPRAALMPPEEPSTPGSVAVLADVAGQLSQCSQGCDPGPWGTPRARGRPPNADTSPEPKQEGSMTRSQLPVSSSSGPPDADLFASSGSLQLEPGFGTVAGEADFVLIDSIPQQAYGRIKPARRMIRDHFLPSYLEALDAVEGSLGAFLDGGASPQDYVDRLPDFCRRLKKS